MKEYGIQMRFEIKHSGKWVTASNTMGTGYAIYTTKEGAERRMNEFKAEWATVDPMKKEPPIDFRIISRTVSEWEPEEE